MKTKVPTTTVAQPVKKMNAAEHMK